MRWMRRWGWWGWSGGTWVGGRREAGKYKEAQGYYDRWVAIEPESPRPYLRKAETHVLAGDSAAAHQVLQLGAQRAGLVKLLGSLTRDQRLHRLLRIFPEYGEAFSGVSQEEVGAERGDYLLTMATRYYADPERARVYYDSLVPVMAEALQALGDNPLLQAIRAQAYAGSGRREAAIGEADAILKTNGELWWREWFVYLLAETYVLVGDHDAAVSQLRDALMIGPGVLSDAYLRLDPVWDPLRDHPRFQALLAKYEN